MPVQVGKILTTLEKVTVTTAKTAGRVSRLSEKAGLVLKKVGQNASSGGIRAAINGDGIATIGKITKLGEKESARLFEYLPRAAQEDFGSLLRSGRKLGYLKTDSAGNILGGSMEKFLSTFDREIYSKMIYLEQNFPNVDKASFRKLLNTYKTTGALAENRVNIDTWLKIKNDLYKYAEALEREGRALAGDAKQEILNATGMLPKARGKGIQSVYDKLSRNVLKGKNIFEMKTEVNGQIITRQAVTEAERLAAARAQIGDLVGTRLILDDISPEKIQRIVDGLCRDMESGKFKITELQNYSNGSKKYFTEAQCLQLQKSAAKCGYELKILESEQTSISGYVSAQMNVTHASGALGELQIRGSLMHKYCELEHIPYDIRQGKNLGKNIPELESFFEPVENAVHSLKRNGLDKAYDDYIMKCYRYVRGYEAGEIAGEFKLPSLPSSLKDYQMLSFENLERIHDQAEKIKEAALKVAKIA